MTSITETVPRGQTNPGIPRTALVLDDDMRELVGTTPADTRVALWDDYESGVIEPESVEFVVINIAGGAHRRKHLAEMPNLVGVRTQSIGYDWIIDDLPKGVALFNSSDVTSDTTAETGTLGIVASLRSLPEHLDAGRRGEWISLREVGPGAGGAVGVIGSTVLVLGQGGVGRGIADRLEAFKARVVRFARSTRTGPNGEKIYSLDELDQWLGTADAVAIALPLNDATERLVDAQFLSKMKPGAVLGNVGRGRIVDTNAIVEAASSGRIRAALDVVDPEPLPRGHPLWQIPGVMITPHAGASSRAVRENMMPSMARMASNYLWGKEVGNPILIKE